MLAAGKLRERTEEQDNGDVSDSQQDDELFTSEEACAWDMDDLLQDLQQEYRMQESTPEERSVYGQDTGEAPDLENGTGRREGEIAFAISLLFVLALLSVVGCLAWGFLSGELDGLEIPLFFSLLLLVLGLFVVAYFLGKMRAQ